MSARPRLLLVEDEEAIVAGLEYALAKEGFELVVARDGEAAAAELRREPGFDLVILDLMLPKRSGLDVLRGLRSAGSRTPVILLTARAQEADKVRGFDLGADDYVTKPFGLAELVARIRARLRASAASEPVPERIELGGAVLDLRELSVSRSGSTLGISVREADMLRLLWRNRGQTVPRKNFLREVWGHDRPPTTRTVDQHIVKLRQKIESDPASPRHILTVFGVGYRLEV